jgi:hypothetical protein
VKGSSPVQRVLPSAYRIMKLKNEEGPKVLESHNDDDDDKNISVKLLL